MIQKLKLFFVISILQSEYIMNYCLEKVKKCKKKTNKSKGDENKFKFILEPFRNIYV